MFGEVDARMVEVPPRARLARRTLLVRLLLGLLVGHFALVQLATGVQFGDATRNLHWGVLTSENPAFLSGAPDSYERNKGFIPEPPDLAPRGLAGRPPAGLHAWWGPVTPLLFAAVWRLTHTYTALQLVIPCAAGASVLLVFLAARRQLGVRQALLAAAFLSVYPLFRDYGTVSYNEALGTLVLTGALFAYLSGRTLLTILLGALAALTKMDLVGIAFGTMAVCAAYDRLWGGRTLPWRHHLAALVGPLVIAAPWIWGHYLGSGARPPSRGLSAELFAFIVPQMLQLTFFIPWYAALLTLAAIGAAVVAGLRARALAPLTTVLLTTWLGLGLLVTLLYCATPGAGNSPRIFIPALPALALLFAAGFPHLPGAWRRRIGFYLAALFVVINLTVIGYRYVSDGAPLRAAGAAFAELRNYEQGFVLTPRYWETILYARRQATWFEFDPAFERNMLDDAANFQRYVNANRIRYVLLPTTGQPAALAARAYLDANAEVHSYPGWTLWVLRTE